MDNVKFLNYVRAVASNEYQDRIPTATKGNLEDIQEIVTEYSLTKNEFIDILLNKIVRTMINNKYYENPFKFFKKGQLPVGKTIESIFVDIIKAKDFSEKFGDGSSEASSLLAKEKANVKVEYYSENYRHKYKISVSDEQLKSAFVNVNGLQDLTNKIVTSALTSAEFDEYLLVKQTLCTVPMSSVEVDNTKLTDDEVTAKLITKMVKTYINKFRFLSSQYNAQGVHTHSLPKDMVVIVTPETKAMIDVELLATAFNLDKVEMEGRLVMIDEFQKFKTGNTGEVVVDEDTLAIVCDIDTIQMYESLNTSESFRNPDTLTTNMFFHRWGTICGCGFTNAIRIKKTTAV